MPIVLRGSSFSNNRKVCFELNSIVHYPQNQTKKLTESYALFAGNTDYLTEPMTNEPTFEGMLQELILEMEMADYCHRSYRMPKSSYGVGRQL